jgi:hypothetical protein
VESLFGVDEASALPPQRGDEMPDIPTQPRSLRDEEARKRRHAMLEQPHILPLTRYVVNLRKRCKLPVPYFDPMDGGTNARVLFLLEKPGPKAAASDFISRDNDDQTAANVFNFMEEAQIPRGKTVLWNAIPAWNDTLGFDCKDVEEALPHLDRLIPELKALKAVVFVGKTAASVKFYVHGKWPDVKRFSSPHPSPRNVNRRPLACAEIVAAWRKAAAVL